MNISSILVPVDFSDVTGSVIQFAGNLAQALRARITLLHVTENHTELVGLEPLPVAPGVTPEVDVRTEHHHLLELKKELHALGVDTTVVSVHGHPRDKILQEAVTQQAGLIVVGNHGHGPLYHLLIGSVATSLLKAAPCPVVVVPAPRPEPLTPALEA